MIADGLIQESDIKVSTDISNGDSLNSLINKVRPILKEITILANQDKLNKDALGDTLLKLFDEIFTIVQNDRSVPYEKKLGSTLGLFKNLAICFCRRF